MNASDSSPFHIEPGTEKDVDLILNLIKGLAEYEKLSHEVTATPQKLRDTLFGPNPAAEVIIGYAGAEPGGFALFFPTYSTFLGRPGLYLEDLFVVPKWRNQGLGHRLLKHLAGIALERGYGRMDWSVLNWNESAIRFYKKLGANTDHAIYISKPHRFSWNQEYRVYSDRIELRAKIQFCALRFHLKRLLKSSYD